MPVTFASPIAERLGAQQQLGALSFQTTASSTVNVWPIWAQTTSSATTAVIWNTWTAIGPTSGYAYTVDYEPGPLTRVAPAPTPEQLAEREERAQAARAAAAKATQERNEAEARARALLVLHLDDVQKAQLEHEGTFEVITHAGKTYRIRRNQRVVGLDTKKKATAEYCIHPAEWVPPSDTMLIQKLWLEANEAAFLQTANMSRVG